MLNLGASRHDETHAYLAAIVESSEDAIIGNTLEGVITSWNRGAERVYGYTADEVVGRTMLLLLPPDRRDELAELLTRLARGERIERYETIRMRSDGERIDVSLSMSPIRGRNERIIGAATIARDITARNRADLGRERMLADARRALAETTALARARAMYEAVALHLADGLAIIDLQGRVVFCNPRLEQLLDFAPGSIVGRPFLEAIAEIYARTAHPETTLRESLGALRAAEEGATVTFEYRLEGELPRWIAVRAFPIRAPEGDLIGHGRLVQDITSDREINTLKDELVSVVSHELRTPLASLVGFTELLRTRSYGESERHEFLDIMWREGQRLTTLIDDFLHLQRLDSGREEITRSPTALAPLIEQVVAEFRDDPLRPISFDLSESIPQVLADPARITQVLVNLLGNARKYSPDGGCVRIGVSASSEWVEVAVSDEGLGIPPHAMPQLFASFFRIQEPEWRSIGGTGLGLAICQRIVEAHGGSIYAESPGRGKGSTFRFTLPVAETRNDSGDVLIVENDEAYARLLEAALAVHGLTAVVCSSAEAALPLLEQVKPVGILLDLMLPGMAGDRFLEQLRAVTDRHLPVVVVSMKELTPAEHRALHGLSVVAVLHKGPGVAALAARTITEAVFADH